MLPCRISLGLLMIHPWAPHDLPDTTVTPMCGLWIPQVTHDSVPTTPVLPSGMLSSTTMPSTVPLETATSTLNPSLPSKNTASRPQPAIPTSTPGSTHTFKRPIQAPTDYMHTRSTSGIVVPKKHFISQHRLPSPLSLPITGAYSRIQISMMLYERSLVC
jgi:hypothetical protein